MKILILSPGLYPDNIGGMEVYNYHFALFGKEHNHEIITLSSNKNPIDDKIKNVKLIFKNSILANIQIFLTLIFSSYDLIHFPYTSNSKLVYSFLLYKFFKGKNKYIIYIHGGGLHQWRKKKLQEQFFKYAADVISISKPIKLEYEKRINQTINIILPLIRYNRSKKDYIQLQKELNTKSTDIILLYVGSIKEIKGSDFLIESLARLGKKFFIQNNIKAIFIGKGDYYLRLKNFIKKEGLEKYIWLLGEKQRELIPDYMKIANIFINASWFEGTPLTILEAMFNKLIILSSDVSGINNIIMHKKTGFLYKRENENDFINNLNYILSNIHNLNYIGVNAGKEYFRKYNPDQEMMKHFLMYEKLI